MKRILNIGCGNESYGTDRIDFVKTNTTTKVCNFEKGKLPYPSNYFDEIYCKSVIEHIKNLGNLIDEIHRVLKSGGKIWIRTDYAGYIAWHISKKHEHNFILNNAYGHKSMEDAHYHLFVESHLRFLFKRFKNIKINYFYGGRNGFIRLIMKILPFNLGAFHIDLEAIK